MFSEPIAFSMVDGDQNVTENKSGMINCEVFGDPRPTILWHAKGKPVQGNLCKSNFCFSYRGGGF